MRMHTQNNHIHKIHDIGILDQLTMEGPCLQGLSVIGSGKVLCASYCIPVDLTSLPVQYWRHQWHALPAKYNV